MTAPQTTPRHLLFATDLSARCDRARDRAMALAGAWKARLTVVHALDVLDAPNDQPSRPVLAGAAGRAEELLRADFADVAGLDIEFEVGTGRPGEVVLDIAAAKGCDLVVTGIAGNDPMGQSLLGSAIAIIARAATMPVLVVKKRPREPYRRITVASDLSEASKPALRAAQRLFPTADLTLLHVFDMPFRMLADDREGYRERSRLAAVAEAGAFLAGAEMASSAPAPRILAMHGDPASCIADHAAREAIDLVVAGTHGRTGLLNMLLGSVASAILDETPCDVLIVPGGG